MLELPAQEFLSRFTNAYGMTWEELFSDLIESSSCAKHMAEFIDDLEEHGQEQVVYIDKDGIVSEGNKVALGLWVMGKEIKYKYGDAPVPDDSQLFEVDFEVPNSKGIELFFNHIVDFLSFRVEKDWVQPLDAETDGETVVVTMFCPSGQYTADRLMPVISDRLERLAGVQIEAGFVSALDEETLD